MRCILDIGTGKTGSKARQMFLSREIHRVRQGTAHFLEAGRDGVPHRPLCEALFSGDRPVLETARAEVAELAGTCDTLFVSYEGLYSLQHRQIEWLADTFSNITAVLFLRRQDQLLNSLHNQLHKAHRVPAGKIEEFEQSMLAYDALYDLGAVLKRWEAVLGQGAIVPVLFDKSRSAVRAFFHAASVAVDFSDYEDAYPNRAIDAAGLSVMRWVKQLVGSSDDLWHFIDEAHRTLSTHFVESPATEAGYTLSIEQREIIMSFYADSNEWVRRRYFPERRTLFDPLEAGRYVEVDYGAGRELAEKIVSTVKARLEESR